MGEARDPWGVEGGRGVGEGMMRKASLNPALPILSLTTSCSYPEAYSRSSIKDWNQKAVAATLKVPYHLSRPL